MLRPHKWIFKTGSLGTMTIIRCTEKIDVQYDAECPSSCVQTLLSLEKQTKKKKDFFLF